MKEILIMWDINYVNEGVNYVNNKDVITFSIGHIATTIYKNNGTNDKFYRKVAFLMYTEIVRNSFVQSQ